MSVRLKIVGRVDGAETEFDGQYVAAYDPSYRPAGEEYDGGLLLTVEDPEGALEFPDATTALACWRKSYGTRWDGQPNRPLTAFTVELA